MEMIEVSYISLAVILVAALMLIISPRYDEGALGHFSLVCILGSCAVAFMQLLDETTYTFSIVTQALFLSMAVFLVQLALRDAFPHPRWRKERRNKVDRRVVGQG